MLSHFRSFSARYGGKSMQSSYFALFGVLEDVQSRIILSFGILFAIAAGIPLPVIGVIFSKIINSFPPSEEEIHQRVSQLLIVAAAYFIVTWVWASCWGIIGSRISQRLRIQMVHRALGLDQTYYETQCPDITSYLTVDAQSVQNGTAEKVGIFIQSISYFLASFIVGFSLNAHLTAMLFAAVVPLMTVIIYAGTFILDKLSKEAAESASAAAEIAESAIKAVTVVQAFDAFDTLTQRHENHLQRAMEVGVKKGVVAATLLGCVFFVAYAANAFAFWQGAKMTASNGNAGTVYAIIFLILDASFVLGQAGPFIQSFSMASSAGSRILDLINYPTCPIDIYSEKGIYANKYTLATGRTISFDNVSFKYPARPEETVLDSVSFNIETGTTIGIIGASGSGKSTIATLLLRFYDTSYGDIIIDGHRIQEFNLSSLRGRIALVDQDPALFSGKLISNLEEGYNGPKISENELRQRCIKAAKAADAWSFINSLPDGLDTWLGEPSGTKLSGGQKQRICIARALVGDPDLLILDESTSALDTISEASILASLGRTRFQDHRTTIIIAHRLASVKSCDNILVMDMGCVIEQGNHEHLMSLNGTYRRLVEAQKTDSYNSSEVTLSEKSSIHADEDLSSGNIALNRSNSSADFLAAKRTFGAFAIIRRCLALSQARLIFTCLALLCSIVTGTIILGESIIFGHLVSLLKSVPVVEVTNFYCLMFLVLALTAFFSYVISGSAFGIVSEFLISRIRAISLRTILRQDMEWFLQPGRSTSALVAIICMDSGHLSGLSGSIIGTLLSAAVSIVGGAILAHVVAWKIAIVLFATSPIVMLSGFFRLRILAKLEEMNQEAYTEAASLATEAALSLRTIAALSMELKTSKLFDAAISKQQEQIFRATAIGNLLLAFALSVTYPVYAISYWWGSKLVRSGEYSSLQFFIVLPAILFSAQSAGQIFSLAPDIGRARGAASRVFALHDQQPTIDVQLESSVPTESNKTLNVQKGTVTFQNVGLIYNSRSRPIFTNLNMMIKPGETVALVGRSGAGKSSVFSLLERFYDPTSGAVFLDGIDIKRIPIFQHRARISLVAQDPDLFSGTVAFNVGLGVRHGHIASQEEIIEACKAVGIHEFISGLPDGYETQCGKNGSQLSGGQKQRIAIARAYIRDPEILLLDEATSSLDSHSENQIQQAIVAASRKRTTIIIAHRLTSTQKADRILVFDEGKIVEEGRHEELMFRGGIYEQMINAHNLG